MNNKDPSRPDPEKKASGPAPLRVWLRHFTIMALIYVGFDVSTFWLSPEIKQWLVLWTLCGLSVVSHRIQKISGKSSPSMVQSFNAGMKFFVMALAWPILLRKG